jgi:hypothetical protein
MKTTETEKIKNSLVKLSSKVNIIPCDKEEKVFKIILPLNSYKGEPFYFYFYKDKNKIIFSDGGALLKIIRGCGDPRLRAIQKVLETFGLSLMEDLSVMDLGNSKKTMPVRIMSLLQAWCTIDGIIRIWSIAQE